MKRVLLLCLIGHLLSVGTAGSNGLTAVTKCICPGYNVIYQCTVTGGQFTIWGGTAFQCTGGTITLRHSDFGSPSAAGECNNRQIIGHGISQENTCYTSQLNVTLSEGLVGETVTCGADNAPPASVYSIILATSTRPLMPPTNFSMTVTPQRITFLWDHVSDECPGLYYNVTSASNCGTCAPGTEVPQITCSNFSIPVNGINCTLTLQTVICRGTNVAVSGSTTSVTIFLKVPDAPDLADTIPFYQDGVLTEIHISLSKNQFSLSDFVDGSPTSFTIMYADTTGRSCGSGSSTILTNSTSCTNELCTQYFTDICIPPKTIITVFGSNVLGNGRASNKSIDYQSVNFVRTNINLTPTLKEFVCAFQGPDSLPKMCKISIANGVSCRDSLKRNNSNTIDSGAIVSINLDSLISDTDEGKTFCYTLTARAGREEVVLQDTIFVEIITIGNNASQTIIVAILVPIIVILIIVLAIFCFILVVFVYIYIWREKVTKDTAPPRKVQDTTNMAKFGKKERPDYDHTSGKGYVKAKPHEKIPIMSKGIIARRGQKGQYRAGDITQRIFVNKRGVIRSPSKRVPGFRSTEWDVFTSVTGKRTLHPGDEFLYCDANIKEFEYELNSESDTDSGSEDDIPVQKGVDKVKEWYYLYEHTSPKSSDNAPGPFHIPEDSDIISKGDQWKNVYHEKYYIEESDLKGKRPAEKVQPEIKVMAMSEDDVCVKDTERVLLYDSKTQYKDKIFEPPPGWKHLFFLSDGSRPLKDKDRYLFYEPSILPVPTELWHILPVTTDTTLGKVIKRKFKKKNPEDELQWIYLEKQPDKVEDNNKVMALDQDHALCTASEIDKIIRMFRCADYDKVWKCLFVQSPDDTVDTAVKQGTNILYCKYKKHEIASL